MSIRIHPRITTWRWLGAVLLASALAVGCGGPETATETPEAESDTEVAADETADETAETDDMEASGQGTLTLVANGEDFVRQGFTTKDGWEISFDEVLVTLADVEAYQTEPPFDPDSDAELEAVETAVLLTEPETIDLAAGEADAEPIPVSESDAPAGQYNALAWNVVVAESGEAEGAAIVLDGTAMKDGQTIDFVLRFDEPLSYTCGEFVGDARKGIVEADDTAETEATFHFDHIFGDAELPEDDDLNQGALGFEPLAALADGDTLDIELATLEAELDPADYELLAGAIANLGHVGEGHCK